MGFGAGKERGSSIFWGGLGEGQAWEFREWRIAVLGKGL